jgi:hypothetical protein
MAEDLGKLYFEVRADMAKVKSDLEAIKSEAKKTANQTGETFRKAKLDFDNNLAKKKISELRDLLKKYQGEMQRKIEMNVSGRSLDVTRQKLSSVQSALSGVGGEAKGLSGKLLEMGSRFTGLDVSMLKTVGTWGLVGTIIYKTIGIMRDSAKASLEYQDSIYDQSRALGFSIEKSQAFDYMMKKEGKTFESIRMSLSVLTGKLGEAQDETSDSAELFKRLGVSVTDVNGEIRDGESAFEDVIRALSQEENATKRATIQKKLFGRSWYEIAKLVDGGSAAIENAENEVRAFGATVNPEQLNSYKESTARLSIAFTGLKQTVGAVAIGPMIWLNNAFADTVSWTRKALNNLDEFVAAVDSIGNKLPWAKKSSVPEPVKTIYDIAKERAAIGQDVPIPGFASQDTLKAAKAEVDAQFEAHKKMIESKKQYYSIVTETSKERLEFELRLIDEEAMELRKNAGAEIDIEKFKTEKTIELYKKLAEEKAKTISVLTGNVRGGSKKGEPVGSLTEGQSQGWAADTGNFPPMGAEMDTFVVGDISTWRDVGLASMDSFSAGLEEVYSKWALFSQETIANTGNDAARGFMAMANAFEQAVLQMISRWLAFKAIQAGLNLIPGIGPGLSAGFTAIASPGGAEGGTFVGARGGVQKVAAFADGGSFMVPPGFNNDSFPMMVQSGERVNVTPAGRAGDESKLLSQILSATKAQTMTIAQVNSRVNRLEVSAGSMSGRDIQLVVEKEQRISNRLR